MVTKINEAGIIAALHDKGDSLQDVAAKDPIVKLVRASEVRNAAAKVMTSPYLNVNLKSPGTNAALRDAFSDAILSDDTASVREQDIWMLTGALTASGDKTSWVNDVIAELPKTKDPLGLAFTLAGVGHAEGWPYVRAAIATNDVNRIFSALVNVQVFDGMRNPDGGQPIDVARDLHQLAASTPDNLMWPTLGPESQKQRIKDFIERNAGWADKAKAGKRQ